MTRRYSIAEARHNLAAIVHELEQAQRIELTRRGTAVAVLLSIHEYEQLTSKREHFWNAYVAFRTEHQLDDTEVDTLLDNVRDRSEGREVGW
jgi:prevent-host-death family protein